MDVSIISCGPSCKDCNAIVFFKLFIYICDFSAKVHLTHFLLIRNKEEIPEKKRR